MLITNDILIFIFNRWQPKYGPGLQVGVHAAFGDNMADNVFVPRSSTPSLPSHPEDQPEAAPGPSTDQPNHTAMPDRGVLDTSGDTEDTEITEDIYSCQSLTNCFARQNGIGIGNTEPFREHTFLLEIRRKNISYAKCLFCTNEFEIDTNNLNSLFLPCATHMSCALYDGKINILPDMVSVQKVKGMNIQLRKVLVSSNMVKSSYSGNWDPSVTFTVVKSEKRCRLVDLPRLKKV